MKTNRSVQVIVMFLMAAGVLLTSSQDAFADRGRDRGRGRKNGHHKQYRRHHPRYGRVVNFPRLLAKVIIHSGFEFYYHHGYYYRHSPRGYVVVDPPIGAVVASLPPGYRRVYVNKRPFYYYNDVYYVLGRGGYIVVADPVYRVADFPEEVDIIEAVDDAYTVNIPNKNGSFTAVMIKSAGSGYVGPQGEYYDDFPSVNQLQRMYGK